MKRIFLLSAIAIMLVATTRCSKPKGTATFYSNAHYVLDCGQFDLNIYIDNQLAGVIKKPYLPINNTPNCNQKNNDTFLVIEKPYGSYEFEAKLTCNKNLIYKGTFNIDKDDCSLIFIDAEKFH